MLCYCFKLQLAVAVMKNSYSITHGTIPGNKIYNTSDKEMAVGKFELQKFKLVGLGHWALIGRWAWPLWWALACELGL